MLTHRRSISAVCGYSSLSIMFFGEHSDMSRSASGSIQVVTKVARLSRALPSSMSSSWMIWYAVAGAMPTSGKRSIGTSSSSSSPNCGRKLRWAGEEPLSS
jgi:hypothetical protein